MKDGGELSIVGHGYVRVNVETPAYKLTVVDDAPPPTVALERIKMGDTVVPDHLTKIAKSFFWQRAKLGENWPRFPDEFATIRTRDIDDLWNATAAIRESRNTTVLTVRGLLRRLGDFYFGFCRSGAAPRMTISFRMREGCLVVAHTTPRCAAMFSTRGWPTESCGAAVGYIVPKILAGDDSELYDSAEHMRLLTRGSWCWWAETDGVDASGRAIEVKTMCTDRWYAVNLQSAYIQAVLGGVAEIWTAIHKDGVLSEDIRVCPVGSGDFDAKGDIRPRFPAFLDEAELLFDLLKECALDTIQTADVWWDAGACRFALIGTPVKSENFCVKI